MDRSIKPLDVVYGGAVGVQQRQRVLRNTYALLALSMVPTVLGAWLGVAVGGFSLGGPLMTFVAFLAISFGFFYAIEKFKDSGVGVLLLLGFTFFMGLMMSRLLSFALGLGNGAQLIGLAFGGTGLIFAVMATLSSVIKRDLGNLGKWLAVGAVVLLVAALANVWLQMPALTLAIAAMVVLVFSAFILYDLKRIVDGGETNYVTATLALYLNVYNVFSGLLQLLMALGGSDD